MKICLFIQKLCNTIKEIKVPGSRTEEQIIKEIGSGKVKASKYRMPSTVPGYSLP